MPMVSLIATKDYPYGTRKLKAGDVFEASERDAELLTKVGMAKAADTPRRRYRRKDLQAEE